ncbi:MAG: hypothetical protein KA369_17045 [Spirochaetes bacterium]|nr:hypothetical protein [Spirochaetota bacterium]
MKHLPCCLLILAALICYLPSGAEGAGIGLYGSYDYTVNIFNEQARGGDWGYRERFVAKSHRADFGLVIDSAVARDSLFNYRLNIGGGFGPVDVKKTGGGTNIFGLPISSRGKWHFNVWDIQMFHSFGFGVVRTETVRLWLGPQLGFGYAGGGYGQVFFKMGPVIGLNINAGDVFTFFIDGGYRFNVSAAKVPDLSIGHGAFGEIGMLFRISDTYR